MKLKRYRVTDYYYFYGTQFSKDFFTLNGALKYSITRIRTAKLSKWSGLGWKELDAYAVLDLIGGWR